MTEMFATVVGTFTSLAVFWLGIIYERKRNRRLFIKQFFAELQVNQINLDKTIVYSKKCLEGKSTSEIENNEITVDNENKLFITPVLDESVIEILRHGIQIDGDNQQVLEYYAMTKRFNWLVDRVKGFRIRLNALETLVKTSESLISSISNLNNAYTNRRNNRWILSAIVGLTITNLTSVVHFCEG